VKEEDKNILMGDSYVAPVTTQFAGFGNIFIMPDQAAVAASYNRGNSLIPNTDLGVTPRHEGDTGSVETFWPCVGAARVVPDYMSLFPTVGQNSPFAGATRNLCDRKEVTLEDQMTVLAKFMSLPPPTSPLTSPARSRTISPRNSIRSPPTLERSSRRRTCPYRLRIGPETKFRASIPMTGAFTTA
jgi:hypothetical protein